MSCFCRPISSQLKSGFPSPSASAGSTVRWKHWIVVKLVLASCLYLGQQVAPTDNKAREELANFDDTAKSNSDQNWDI
jgi:hypothetical protein